MGAITEACERSDLNGASCASLGFVSGKLTCSETCYLDISRCEECIGGDAVSTCVHSLDEHNDASLPALAANGDSLALAFTTGTSTANGYSGDTSVRLAMLDSNLSVTRTVALPMRYASALSLAPDSDGWLLLVETQNYVGFDAPPDGVLQTLLSFDAAGTPRGAVTFHDRSAGALIARKTGGPPLYVYTEATDGTPTVYAQVLSYDAAKNVAPIAIDAAGAGELIAVSCGVGIAGGYELAVLHGANSTLETFRLIELLELAGASVKSYSADLTAPELGTCAYVLAPNGPALIYQARDTDQFGASMHWLDLRTFAGKVLSDSAEVEAYRGLGTADGAVVLRAHVPAVPGTDLSLVGLDASGNSTSTLPIARGASIPSYDMVRSGDDAIVAWISDFPAGQPLGRLGLARVALGSGAAP